MGIHAEGHGLVAMPQLLRHAGDIGAAGNGNAGKGAAKFMRVKVLDAVPLAEPLEVSGRSLGIHYVRLAFLGKYPLTDTYSGLLALVLAQELQHVRIDVDGPEFAALGRIQVNAFMGRCRRSSRFRL